MSSLLGAMASSHPRAAGATPIWTYDFTGTDNASWSGSYFGYMDGTVTIQGNRGQMATPNGAFNISVAWMLASQIPDGIFEIRFDVQFSAVADGWFTPTILDEGDYELTLPGGGIRISAAGVNGSIGAVSTSDVLHYAIAASGTWRGIKVWRNADPEPSAWTLEGTVAGTFDSTRTILLQPKTGSGGVGFSSFIDNMEMYDEVIG